MLLSHVSSLRLSSGHSDLVLTLSMQPMPPCLTSSLVVDASIWATSPLEVAVRRVFCVWVCFPPPGYVALFQNFPQFIVIHTVKGFGIVNKAEIDVFLELPCFFDDPADVGNLISGSCAFSKSSLNTWKFTVHILLKPGLENFEHYFTSVRDECNYAVV